jgi:tetratricopeptide (TPR) repeat protein
MAWQADRPPVLAGLRLAKMTLAKGDANSAIDIFQQVLDIAPDAAEAHYGWGASALALGRKDEAVAAFHRAFGINPPDPEAGLRLAEIALSKRENLAALDFYQRTLGYAPNLAEAHYGWGVAALELGRADEALNSFRRAWEANPTHIAAGLRLAELSLAKRENVVALDVFQQVLALAPNLAEVHYGWGVAALELGRIDEAMAAFKSALALKPDYVSAIAAVGFLSLFPQRNPVRRMPAKRALVCIPILPFLRDWLGGQIYLLNFARIISSLPNSRRPRIVIAILMNDWQKIPTLRQVI